MSEDDVTQLRDLNERFIEACRQGSWEDLEPVLSNRFAYLDGSTGERWEMSRYIDDLRENPLPNLAIDQVDIHVVCDTAGVSARTTGGTGAFSRYLDVYAREGRRMAVRAGQRLATATKVNPWGLSMWHAV